MIDLAKSWKGRLANNAGIINRTLVETTSLEAWLKVNLTGAFRGIQAASLVAETGGGTIVNISSNSGYSGHYDPAYQSMGASRPHQKCCHAVCSKNICTHAVCPGLVVTGINARARI